MHILLSNKFLPTIGLDPGWQINKWSKAFRKRAIDRNRLHVMDLGLPDLVPPGVCLVLDTSCCEAKFFVSIDERVALIKLF